MVVTKLWPIGTIQLYNTRNLYIMLNSETIIISTGNDFPQGGVCIAKFWVISYDNTVVIQNENKDFGQVVADDSITLKEGKKLHLLMS